VLSSWLPASASRHFSPTVVAKVAQSDVVFVTGLTYWTSRLAFLSSLCARRPIVFVSDITSASASVRQRVMLRVLSGLVSAVWVPGKASRSLWIEQGLSPDRVFEGCYCLDVDDLTRTQTRHPEWREATRRRLGIARDQPVALFVGRMVAERDIPSLLTSFESVSKALPRAHLVVVGDGPYRRWAEEYARCRGVAEVTFLDPVHYDELMPLYAAADVYIQPSVWEPYSLSTAQAATMGLPIVCTDAVGAAQDYVVDGVTGYCVPTSDVAALAGALRDLLGNPGLTGRMGQVARQRAASRTVEWAAREFVRAALSAACR